MLAALLPPLRVRGDEILSAVCFGGLSPFFSLSRPSRKSSTHFRASACCAAISSSVVTYEDEAARMRSALSLSPSSGLRTIIEKAGIRSVPTVART